MEVNELVSRLVELGASPEIIELSVSACVANRDLDAKKATRQARNRRYYESKKEIKTSETALQDVLSSSETVLKTSETPSPTRAFFMGEEVREERKKESKEEKVLLTQDSLPEVGNPVIDLKTKKNEIAKRERRAELLAFGEQWNAMAARFNLKTIDSIKAGSAREKQALARLQELKSEYHSNIEVVLRKISSSLFLTGRKTDFVASFDWVIKAANFTKIMEDNYENQKRGPQELNGRPYQRA